MRSEEDVTHPIPVFRWAYCYLEDQDLSKKESYDPAAILLGYSQLHEHFAHLLLPRWPLSGSNSNPLGSCRISDYSTYNMLSNHVWSPRNPASGAHPGRSVHHPKRPTASNGWSSLVKRTVDLKYIAFHRLSSHFTWFPYGFPTDLAQSKLLPSSLSAAGWPKLPEHLTLRVATWAH